MTKEEIETALEMPWYKIVEFAKDPKILQDLLSLALSKGYQLGQLNLSKNMNKAFRGYDKVTITN